MFPVSLRGSRNQSPQPCLIPSSPSGYAAGPPPSSQKRRWKLRIPEKISYLLATVGIIGDHLSTRLGLTKPYLYETNPHTIWLMEKGIWLPFDLLLLLATVGTCFLIMRRWTFKGRWALLAVPIVLGSGRLYAAIWNLHLYLF